MKETVWGQSQEVPKVDKNIYFEVKRLLTSPFHFHMEGAQELKMAKNLCTSLYPSVH